MLRDARRFLAVGGAEGGRDPEMPTNKMDATRATSSTLHRTHVPAHQINLQPAAEPPPIVVLADLPTTTQHRTKASAIVQQHPVRNHVDV